MYSNRMRLEPHTGQTLWEDPKWMYMDLKEDYEKTQL